MDRDPGRPLVNEPTTKTGVPMGALRAFPFWLQELAIAGRVSARAILLWAEIASLTKHGRRSVCDASQEYLAGRLPPRKGRPVSVRTVARYLEELELAGAISIVRRPGWPNTYVPHLEPIPRPLPLFAGPGTPAGSPEATVGGPQTDTPGASVRQSIGKQSEQSAAAAPADLAGVVAELLSRPIDDEDVLSIAAEADRLPAGREALQEIVARGALNARAPVAYLRRTLELRNRELVEKGLDRAEAEKVARYFDAAAYREELERSAGRPGPGAGLVRLGDVVQFPSAEGGS